MDWRIGYEEREHKRLTKEFFDGLKFIVAKGKADGLTMDQIKAENTEYFEALYELERISNEPDLPKLTRIK